MRLIFDINDGVIVELPEGGVNNESTPVNEFPVEVAEDLAAIREMLEEEREERQEAEEATTEEATTEEVTTEDPLEISFDRPVDSNWYLSGKVSGYVTQGDIFAMLLSIRNVLFLFLLLWGACKLLGLFKSALYRLMNK